MINYDPDRNPELELLLIPECECRCKLCREACEEAPCWGTPMEIEDLINAGYGKYLAAYIVEPGSYNIANYRGAEPVTVIAPAQHGRTRYTNKSSIRSSFRGRCVFLHGKGTHEICEIHSVGLKPTEGRITSHKTDYDSGLLVRYYIINTWDTDFGRSVARRWEWEYHHHAL